MSPIFLFSDASVCPKTKIGFAAVLLVRDLSQPLSVLSADVRVKSFKEASSTATEIESLLWGLSLLSNRVGAEHNKITVYTDSQGIVGLPSRRERIKRNNYCSKSSRPLNNADLYRQFYFWMDRLTIDIVKVKGHQSASKKQLVDRVFSLVDRASREALRSLS